MAALTPAERARVKYHLGYLGVNTAASLQFGMSRPIQTLFLLEQSMTNLLDEFTDQVRRILSILDGVECRLVQAQSRLAATQLGNLKLRDNEPDLLEHEYNRWGGRLADILGCPFYSYSNRYKDQMTGINIPVRS